MQYHLDTIPVWEAMEQNTACPLCALYRRVEASEIERSLGGSVMEPDARIRVNEKGICARHHGQLFAMQNRLGRFAYQGAAQKAGGAGKTRRLL